MIVHHLAAAFTTRRWEGELLYALAQLSDAARVKTALALSAYSQGAADAHEAVAGVCCRLLQHVSPVPHTMPGLAAACGVMLHCAARALLRCVLDERPCPRSQMFTSALTRPSLAGLVLTMREYQATAPPRQSGQPGQSTGRKWPALPAEYEGDAYSMEPSVVLTAALRQVRMALLLAMGGAHPWRGDDGAYMGAVEGLKALAESAELGRLREVPSRSPGSSGVVLARVLAAAETARRFLLRLLPLIFDATCTGVGRSIASIDEGLSEGFTLGGVWSALQAIGYELQR